MTTLGALETLARILTLRVDLRDEKACAEISPEMAERYLRAKGWDGHGRGAWFIWEKGVDTVMVPACPDLADHGRRMCEVVTEVARAEERSPLAVWAEMMEGSAT